MWFAVGVVVLVRAGFFAASLAGIPTYLVAAAGAGVLLVGNLHRRVVDTGRALRQAPWPILAFAFGMDLVVFGIRNAGITTVISHWMGPAVKVSPAAASFLPGLISAGSSALVNNHPGLITSSLMLLDIPSLARSSLDVAYSAVVLGSDIGALLVPIGTLASLIWFHILQQNGLKYSWWDYLKVTLAVIPVSFILSLLTLWGMAVLMVR